MVEHKGSVFLFFLSPAPGLRMMVYCFPATEPNLRDSIPRLVSLESYLTFFYTTSSSINDNGFKYLIRP